MLLFYIPFPSHDKAKEIAENAIVKGFARCANILGMAEAIYMYAPLGENEKLSIDKEVPVIFKVAETFKDDFIAYIEIVHPYETPAIICVKASANQAFTNWVNRVEL